jgi:hypothetical protein
MADHRVTLGDIKKARAAFEGREPRDLFYRAGAELVDLALRGSTSLTVTEALAVLLQTWNKAYYQYRKFDAEHFSEVEALLARHGDTLAHLRQETIENLDLQRESKVLNLFKAFELVLGPVGAAKALHLLAPRFFPLWDRKIAKEYDVALGVAGSNGNRYWRFMLVSRDQCLDLTHQGGFQGNPLKALDEYNYCKYTKGWLM